MRTTLHRFRPPARAASGTVLILFSLLLLALAPRVVYGQG